MTRAILVGLLLGWTAGAVPPATFTGTIIDAECARASHAAMRMGETDAQCARECVLIHDSAFLLESGDTHYRLSDQKAAERFAAQPVVVVGTLDETTKTIRVESMTAAK
jgi:hypothetical protein